MPQYEFRCKDCKREFLVNAHMGKKVTAKCPRCGSKKTTRIFTPTDFYFHDGKVDTQLKH